MADPNTDTDSGDPFSDMRAWHATSSQSAGPSQSAAPPDDDPFGDMRAWRDQGKPAPLESTEGGAFLHSAERGVAPAAGGLLGAAFGSAAAGAAFGTAAEPGGGTLVGAAVGFGGGLLGFWGGAAATQKAQDYALSKAPDSWKDALGVSDRQQQLDEQMHPTASFLGGLAPYAITMSPFGLAKKALPEGASAFERLMANPMTQRLFGGTVMGGMELGQEALNGQVDWRNVAISTGFGVIFNRPNKVVGERLVRMGESPFRPREVPAAKATPPSFGEESAAYDLARGGAEEDAAFGVNTHDEYSPGLFEATKQENAEEEPQIDRNLHGLRFGMPTVDEVNSWNLMGEGVDEAVAVGAKERAEGPSIAANNARGEEIVATGQTPQPDIEYAARRIDPDAFEQYDALRQRRASLAQQIADFQSPSQGAFDDLARQRGALEQQLTELVDAQHGWAGGEAVRRLRAQIRDVQQQNADLWARKLAFDTGQAVEAPETAAFRQQLVQTDQQLRDLDTYSRIRAAREQAAERLGEFPIEPAVAAAPATRGATLLPAEGAPLATAEPAAAEAAPPPVETPEPNIASQVEPALVAAGMAPEHAGLAAQIQAHIFSARARWFAGKRGTPEQMFKESGPIFRGERNVSRETRQPVIGPRGVKLPSRGDIAAKVNEAQRKQAVVSTIEKLDKGTNERLLAPRPRAPVKPDGPRPQTMREFLTGKQVDPNSQGAADLAQVLGVKPKNGKGPFRTGGMSVDDLRVSAAEQGHLGADTDAAIQHTTINDLLGAVENNQVSKHDQILADDWRRFDDAQEWWKESREREAAVSHWLIEHEPTANSPRLKLIASRLLGEGVFTSYRDAVEGANELLEREKRGWTPPDDNVPLFQQEEGAPEAPPPAEDPFAGLEQEFFQASRGSIKFGGQRPLVTLTQLQNAATVIHEAGHQLLELLLGDADHELAPAQLRADAATVRRALDMKADQARPTRNQHEQFAKWFEQYMREGVAPSRGLERVFAEFRKLLLGVYKTIKSLGVPITDDIRQVFDRALTGEEKPIIAKAHPPGPHLADIHRAEASYTPPHEAEAVVDRVINERDREIEGLPLEVANEHENTFQRAAEAYANANGQAGAGAGGPAQVDNGGGGPAVNAGGAAGGAERGKVVNGGGRAVPEGANAGAAGPERAGNAGPNAGQAAGAQQFAARSPESLGADRRGLDKAGNIRIENLTNKEELAHWIRDSAENNDQFRHVRGPMTEGQLQDLASALGLEPGDINQQALADLLGGFDNLAPKVLAARQTLIRSAQAVHEAMQNVDPRDPETVRAFAEAIARHDMMATALSKATFETGRALSAFKNIAGQSKTADDIGALLKAETGRTYHQLVQLAKLGKQLDTAGKVSKFLRDAQKRSFGKMVIEYWVNGLISGFATHATYTVGNEILTVHDAVFETPMAALIGQVRNAMGRVEATPGRPGEIAGLEEPPKYTVNPRVYAGEAGAKLKWHLKGLPAAVQAMLEAARSGQTTLLPGEVSRPLTPFEGDTTLHTAKRTTNDVVTWHEVAGDIYGMWQGAKDAIHATAELVQAGGVEGAPLWGLGYSKLGQIPDIQVKGVTALPLGTVARLPSRMVAAIHSFFRTLDYSMNKGAGAYRDAVDRGLTGIDRDAHVAQVIQDPSERQMEGWRSNATELTLMGQGGPVIQYISRLTNAEFKLPFFGPTPVLKFIDPFVHIAGNIIQQALIERTPAGILSSKIRADLSGKNGNIAQDMASAKMLVGSLLGLTFGGLAAKGVISGSGPQDPGKSAMWRLAGNQAHSVRIGDVWYDAHRLGPMGMLLGVAADMYDVAHLAAKGQMQEAGAALAHGVAQNVLDESFMRGPSDLIKAIDDPHGGAADTYVAKFFSSMVPFSTLTRQMDRSTDPYVRRARTIMDGIKQTVPGLSETLFPKRDIWGEPLPNGQALIHSGVTAIYERQMSKDPVNQAMVALGMGPAPVERRIRNVQLTEQQYDDYARVAGRLTKARLDTIVRSPDFSLWPQNVRQDVITATIAQSRETARGMIMMQYPRLVIDARNANLRKHGVNEPIQ